MSIAMNMHGARLWTSSRAVAARSAMLSPTSMRHASHMVASHRAGLRQPIQAGAISLTTRSFFTHRKPRPVRTTLRWALFGFTITFGLAYTLDSRSAIHRWIAIPILQTVMEPESAQKLAIKLLSLGVMPRDMIADDEVLAAEVAGLSLKNPIGLAAGFDKQAEAVDGLLDLGFGIVEIGSVTPQPQPGNDLPRYFRLSADRAAINRFGFNSDGHEAVVHRLRDRIQAWLLGSSSLAKSRIPFPDANSASHRLLENATIETILASDDVPKSLRQGQLLAVNLGKNKSSAADSVDDYVQGVKVLGAYADLLVVNISSPNTPGLRQLQRKESLVDLMGGVVQARDQLPLRRQTKVPILVKIAPDLSKQELHDIADAAVSSGVEGLIVSNTTIQRPASLLSTPELTTQTGGLSGAPLKPLALEALQTVRKRVGKQMTIIGCGGIFSGQDALDFAKAGADAVELYTSFGYEGVGHPRRVKDELTALLRAQGTTWKASVGTGLTSAGRDTAMALPSNEKPTTLVTGDLQDRFGATVAGVKGEIEEWRRTLGMAVGDKERTVTEDGRVNVPSAPRTAKEAGIFRPNPSDKAYTSLLDKVHEALELRPYEEEGLQQQQHLETDLSQSEAQRLRVGMALQDPSVAPSVALQGAGADATVASGTAPTSGRMPQRLTRIDPRFASANAARSDEGRIGMGGKSDFNAADRKRVV